MGKHLLLSVESDPGHINEAWITESIVINALTNKAHVRLRGYATAQKMVDGAPSGDIKNHVINDIKDLPSVEDLGLPVTATAYDVMYSAVTFLLVADPESFLYGAVMMDNPEPTEPPEDPV